MTSRKGLVLAGASVLIGAASVEAQERCEAINASCYPWRIEAGARDTVLLEIVPNHVVTNSTYRVCLCPPVRSVGVLFDYRDSSTSLGTVEDAGKGAVCRDFKIQAVRSSRLIVRRADGSRGAIEGCYASF